MEQGQVVLGEGAVSFQRRGEALHPPQLPIVWGLLFLWWGQRLEMERED